MNKRKQEDIIVKPITSACVKICTPDINILCDPWFTQGIHGGTWFQYPHANDLYGMSERLDYIFISHIHEDHYDPNSLRKVIEKQQDLYQSTPEIIIASRTNPNYLEFVMRRDGFTPTVCDKLSISDTEILLSEYYNGNKWDIDSLMVVKYKEITVVNMNDIPFIHQKISEIIESLSIKSPNLLLTAHCGAGPYPQMYFRKPEIFQEHETKLFFNIKKFLSMVDLFQPEWVVPFAADYLLGSGLSSLNEFRGMYDTFYAGQLRENIIPVDLRIKGGLISAKTGFCNARQTEPQSSYEGYKEYLQYIDSLPRKTHIKNLTDDERIELIELHWKEAIDMVASSKPKSLEISHSFLFQIVNDFVELKSIKTFELQVGIRPDSKESTDVFITADLLLGLISRRVHWNNISGGSQVFFKRMKTSKHGYMAENHLIYLYSSKAEEAMNIYLSTIND